MSDLKIGHPYKVTASGGLNLRKEPTTSADVIVVMKEHTYVTLESDEVRESDGYHWYNVSYEGEIGWAASEYLELVPVDEAEAPPIGDIRFRVFDNWYSISTANFDKCVGTFIFVGTVGQLGQQLIGGNGRPLTQQSDGKAYWTTQQNMNTMVSQHKVSVLG